MEGRFDSSFGQENRIGARGGAPPTDGRPPIPLAGAYRQYVAPNVGSPRSKRGLIRQSSFVNPSFGDLPNDAERNRENGEEEDFCPIVRSGAWTDIGFRRTMEDAYVCFDNFHQNCKPINTGGEPSAFYGVFDGHGGKHAADFACTKLPKFLIEDEDFPGEIERAMASAFLQTDTAFAEACSSNSSLASGTTALAAVLVGRSLVVANAGDCRAVLCRRGKAIELSDDHKPVRSAEKKRIESLGGYVYDGYLNGQLNVARAIGDWHMEGLKERDGLGPLTAEPEVKRVDLTQDDEFLIIGCDGIWDVFLSQNAVDFARRKLQEHNDPSACSKQLVDEALKRKSCDNLAAVVVCFQTRPPPVITAPRPRVQRSISAEGLKELQSFLDSLP